MKKSSLISVLCLLLSCQLDYSIINEMEGDLNETPDIVLYNFDHSIYEMKEPKYNISADEGRFYNELKQNILSNYHIGELEKMEEIRSASGGKLTMFTDTENMEFDDQYDFTSSEDEIQMEGDYLYWDAENKEIYSGEESSVFITKGKNTEITGKNLNGDLESREINLDSVEGSYSDEEN